MIQQYELSLPPYPRGYHIITNHLLNKLKDLPTTGIMHVFIKHTSAGLSINENADPSVRDDFESFMNKLVPENDPVYSHIFEGSDDMPAHLKSSLIGSAISIPIHNGRLNLGSWQGIYLCEFRDHGGSRKLVVTVIGENER
ncbi:MAG: secondary thiamine-phosphate synthase enzyme YjbQ [Bacteroidota bacterium]|nr:secondary thiamine-phosphate synthase enzyme YjbQ [Bacteroidota bacterium]